MFPLALPLISLLAATPSTDTVTLRYGLHPEASYEQTFSMSFALKMDAEGTDPETGESSRQTLKNVEQTRAVTVSVVTGAEEEGGTSMEWGLSKVSGATITGGQEVPVIGLEKLEGRKLGDGRMAGDRTAIEMEISVGDAVGHIPGLRERLVQVMPALPREALAIGDTFEVPASLEVPGPPGQGQMRVDSSMIYTLESVTGTQAVFDIKQELSLSRSEEGGEPSMTLTGNSSGSASFDLQEGLFSSVRMQTTVEMVLRRMAPRPAKEGGVTTIPIRIMSTVRGPIEFTMKRVEEADPGQSR